MQGTMFEILLDYGSLGLMCAVLLYSHFQQQKRNDSLFAHFQEQLEKLRASSKEDEEKIRVRFEKVVEKYDSERSAFFEERTQLRSNLAHGIAELRKLEESNGSRMDNIMVSLEALLQSHRDAANEQRLRDLARAAKGRDAK